MYYAVLGPRGRSFHHRESEQTAVLTGKCKVGGGGQPQQAASEKGGDVRVSGEVEDPQTDYYLVNAQRLFLKFKYTVYSVQSRDIQSFSVSFYVISMISIFIKIQTLLHMFCIVFIIQSYS